ncbi:hypothetical protein Scep_002314 [Stephania cephalantha]|uniref:Uncharacterized protein n=1 Tax=Stephania cephalantha TaxID=152367 RepID=A0AAP0Q4V1_9MAGN
MERSAVHTLVGGMAMHIGQGIASPSSLPICRHTCRFYYSLCFLQPEQQLQNHEFRTYSSKTRRQ